MGFSERVKVARIAARMTQHELAEELGVSAQAVRLWEHGLRRPGVNRVSAMARVLGVTLEHLMGEESGFDKKLIPGLEQLLRAKKMYGLKEEDQEALKSYIEYLYSKKR